MYFEKFDKNLKFEVTNVKINKLDLGYSRTREIQSFNENIL